MFPPELACNRLKLSKCSGAFDMSTSNDQSLSLLHQLPGKPRLTLGHVERTDDGVAFTLEDPHSRAAGLAQPATDRKQSRKRTCCCDTELRFRGLPTGVRDTGLRQIV